MGVLLLHPDKCKDLCHEGHENICHTKHVNQLAAAPPTGTGRKDLQLQRQGSARAAPTRPTRNKSCGSDRIDLLIIVM